jgi:hypothetical protein
MTTRINSVLVITKRKLFETAIYPGFYIALSSSLALAFVLVYMFADAVGSSGFDPNANPVYELVSRFLTGFFGATFSEKLIAEGPFLFALFVSFFPMLAYLSMSSTFRFGFEKNVGAIELITYGPADGTSYIIASLAKDLICSAISLCVLMIFFALSAIIFNLALGSALFFALLVVFFFAFAVFAYGIFASAITDNEASSVAVFIALFIFFAFIQIGSFALTSGYVKNLSGTLAWIAQWFSPLFYWNAGLDSIDGENFLLYAGSLACMILLGCGLLVASHFILKTKGVRA